MSDEIYVKMKGDAELYLLEDADLIRPQPPSLHKLFEMNPDLQWIGGRTTATFQDLSGENDANIKTD